jgi:ParB family transcriptional regulator, chromosome partitioning protein
MVKIQTGLGKGLGALISDVNSIQQKAYKQTNEVQRPLVSISEIDITLIEPNPYQPRTEFNQEAIEELSDSIKLLGLIQPITVRPVDGNKFQIISGERRFRASKLAGLTSKISSEKILIP